jgi:hypothetical protein
MSHCTGLWTLTDCFECPREWKAHLNIDLRIILKWTVKNRTCVCGLVSCGSGEGCSEHGHGRGVALNAGDFLIS